MERIDVLIQAPYRLEYALLGDAGVDLRSTDRLVLEPGARAVAPTGVRLVIPPGFAGLVMPRSGLAANFGVGLVNSPGVIDSGFRGEIMAVMLNTNPDSSYTINPGDRIAQLVVMPVAQVSFRPVQILPSSERGEAGFGSTGIG